MLKSAIISGANNIINHKVMVDEMNVFPVPDGDTGTNMSATIKAALTELSLLPDDAQISTVADVTASAMLRGARGNSGVILSLLFRGLSKGLTGKTEAAPKDFMNAMKMGVEAAYKSVMKPTEGTILTVAREAVDAALEKAEKKGSFEEVLSVLLTEAEASLERTPELLPVLQKAGVTDAGGMGYVVILKGMKQAFEGGGIIEQAAVSESAEQTSSNKAGSFDMDIEFTYCTEYLVIKNQNAEDTMLLRAHLETIGDSVVVVDDDEIIKVHVHTENPGNALEKGLKFGALTGIKIENMKEQHKQEAVKAELQKSKSHKLSPRRPEEKYGFVAVANGAGIETLFKDLGVDRIVRGGQTQNPSTEDILEAVLATPAHNVFVLPNNKNIIMAAEQVIKLADRNVIVLQSRTIPQGLAAMLCFDEELGVSENSVVMTRALDNVGTGAVTYAARDSNFEGKKIKSGEILALENGKLSFTEKEVQKALVKLTRRMIKSDTSYVTVMYGSDVTDEEAEKAFDALRDKINDDIEIGLISGGQPVYYYIISVE
ncbi:MAG: DAK2 domain-containing protein [Oscillospiraceae bacterium]|jgi:DAK2 domain fusion protein YloV|nr:DAK2 domain-containing protein [Oscillospiraceae bacterium]